MYQNSGKYYARRSCYFSTVFLVTRATNYIMDIMPRQWYSACAFTKINKNSPSVTLRDTHFSPIKIISEKKHIQNAVSKTTWYNDIYLFRDSITVLFKMLHALCNQWRAEIILLYERGCFSTDESVYRPWASCPKAGYLNFARVAVQFEGNFAESCTFIILDVKNLA